MRVLFRISVLIFLAKGLSAQYFQISNINGGAVNTVTTAVPFLTINPSARAGGMGELGVVSSSIYSETGFSQNPALLSRYDQSATAYNSYIPWLRSLVPDMFIISAGRSYAIDSMNTIAESFTYFDLNHIVFTNLVGEVIGTFDPYEFVYGLSYGRTLNKNFSVGTGFKFIYSNLTGGYYIETTGQSNPVESWAIDLGFDYRDRFNFHDNSSLRWNLGLAMLNMGPKVRYTSIGDKDFMPANLKLGLMLTYVQKLGDHVQIGIDLGYQVEKLLVPSPPIYQLDSAGNPMLDQEGNKLVQRGKSPNVTAAEGMLQSFSDAPGGSEEELQEIINLFGFEFRTIIKQKLIIAVRLGYFNEHPYKGNRNYLTVGGGITAFGFYVDYSLIPSILTAPNQPLVGTNRFTIGYRAYLNKNVFNIVEN